ncbi:uncharacterized protein LOC114350153 isoform X2 [Ostrinia furnacalis]|uniref:uncharacterized protein LOC114350153 isoform X1 n=1 Tax=Ostrinia furnacalis TaxID=93504 RepID=UPI00103C8B27|nr:uncharacterized protein LOC114350153 isoform X1 [Ostrinia furnacalis]XP_028156624.1 uncharacterized protein LOC114350153 isoform X2 [Ostrinia furnacalis]
MRNVDSHLLDGKMDETVTHYITSHQTGESVHVDSNGLPLNVQEDEGGRVVTVMHPQSYSHSHLCRGVSVGEPVGEGQWGEELLDTDTRLAAFVAHLHHPHAPHHKHASVQPGRDVDTSVILDTPMRLFNGQSLEQQEGLVVEVPALPPLPPLQEMKMRNQEADWFNNKTKTILKDDTPMLTDSDGPVLELGASASPAQNKQNKKSLPHKKRISRKLKRNNGNSTPQQQLVVINCSDEVQQEEILPDNFVASVQHQQHITETHHITHEVRPIFICQICGEFCGEDQLKFYHHLKQHYEPHTIIIENPVPDLAIDKMTNTCIVDNVAALPDSIMELSQSLENTVPKTMYQPMDKHILYTSSDKTLSYSSNKLQYTIANMDKDPAAPATEAEKVEMYELEKLEVYSCVKCNKSFRKLKQCEAHIKEVHKLDDMSEFSEPEDLMEGIHVAVDEAGEPYDHSLLPHLTVENGHVHQDHIRHWYMRNGSPASPPGAGGARCGADGAYCPVCPAPPAREPPPEPHQLKEEVLQRIFEAEVSNPEPSFPENILPDAPPPPLSPPPAPPPDKLDAKKKPQKKFECTQCGRVFLHRNSLMYHLLSHSGKQQVCRDCGKGFYTAAALKVN